MFSTMNPVISSSVSELTKMFACVVIAIYTSVFASLVNADTNGALTPEQSLSDESVATNTKPSEPAAPVLIDDVPEKYKSKFSLVKPLAVTKRQTYVYRGDAFDLETGKKLLYRELHTLYLENDQLSERRVRYERGNGELLASKVTRYKDDMKAPDFTLNDARDGYQEESVLDGNRRRLTLRESAMSKPLTGRLKKPEYDIVVDAGFDEYVRDQWGRLLKGKTSQFSFAVPARQEYVDFRLIPVKITDTELQVEMKLKSRLIAWLMDPIRLTYDMETKRLLRYQGLTNIRDDKGEGIYADIRYRYPEAITP